MITLIDGDLYQWDTGRVVLVEPDEGYTIHEVHFTNKKMDFAYVVNTYAENGVTYCKIPDTLLQQQHSIICYEVRENSSGEESVSKTVFAIIKRNRPEDYIYTEDEKYSYEKIEKRIIELEELATTLETELGILRMSIKNLSDTVVKSVNDILPDENGNVTIEISSPSAIINISDADELTAMLVAKNLGNVYRYTGETNDTYTNGDLYEVIEL